MATTYHLWLEEAVKGPFTLGQLRAMWNSGQLTGENLFSTDVGQNWYYLTELVEQLEPAPTLSIPTAGAPPPLVKGANKTEDDSEYRYQLGSYLQRGWTVTTEGTSGAQLQAKKEMGGLTITCLIFGVLLLAVYGSGLVLIIAALIGHAFKKPATYFLSRNCTEKDRPQFMRLIVIKKWTTFQILLTVLGIIGILIILIEIILFLSNH